MDDQPHAGSVYAHAERHGGGYHGGAPLCPVCEHPRTLLVRQASVIGFAQRACCMKLVSGKVEMVSQNSGVEFRGYISPVRVSAARICEQKE